MGLITLLAGILKPIRGIIDETITNKEELATMQRKLIEIEAQAMANALAYEQKVMEAKQQIIVAEAKGESWLQQSWRPITMLTFLTLVVADTMGYTEFRLAPQAWDLLELGIGGYVIGRTVEKTGVGKAVATALGQLGRRKKNKV